MVLRIPVRVNGAQILRERMESHLQIEGSNWQTIQVLQNDEETLDNQDRGPMLRRDESLKRKRLRKRWIRQWTLDHKKSGVRLICYGNGQCNAKGHRKVPTKRLIREAANVLPVLVLNEFGTSSRCPDCKRPDKMNHENTDQPTTPQVSQARTCGP